MYSIYQYEMNYKIPFINTCRYNSLLKIVLSITLFFFTDLPPPVYSYAPSVFFFYFHFNITFISISYHVKHECSL